VLSFAAAMAGAPRTQAAEAKWIKLQAPRFGVLSQLTAEDTRAWAIQFEQFIDAIHQLYSVNDVELPPLTIVMFKQSRDFAPFQFRTESGQVKVDGFFATRGSWSVIGLTGQGNDVTRHVIQHEAVHWFASASNTPSPLWFSEGIAEVLATFEARDGKGRWGRSIQNHVDYLGYRGLVPLEQFLRKSQDEALHGPAADTYYPEAWAFVHYLLFGNNGTQRSKLETLLKKSRETDLDTAFNVAFGASYNEVTLDLRKYLERGRYAMALFDLHPPSSEMTVEPATSANVAFALARLAIGSDNYDVAEPYVQQVLSAAPNVAAGYELRALMAEHAKDAGAEKAALDRAAELGSRDPRVYALRAEMIFANADEDLAWDDFLQRPIARAAADDLERSLSLRPRNRVAFQDLVVALLNVDSITEQDRALLAAGLRLFPNEGMILVGQAAAEKRAGNVLAAGKLLYGANVEPFVLSARFRGSVTALRNNWMGTWYAEHISEFVADGKFSDAKQFVDEQLADDTVTGRLHTMLELIQGDLPSLERIYAADEAMRKGRITVARDLLISITTSNVSDRVRREAEQRLQRLSAR
jgi:hypothetical protein